MTDLVARNSKIRDGSSEAPRAILRVPEILMAVANALDGISLAELGKRLDLPKTSLHRMLRTLEHGGYVASKNGAYSLGKESGRLAATLNRALPLQELPGSMRPVMEWLERQSGESIILAELTDTLDEAAYIDVIQSSKPLRFTVPTGHTRPLYAAAAGQVLLAFLPEHERNTYLETAEFQKLTAETIGREDLVRRIPGIVHDTVAFDRNGSFLGASAIASPVFDAAGAIRYAVAVAGPTERIERIAPQLEELVREAGERMSRILGYKATYFQK